MKEKEKLCEKEEREPRYRADSFCWRGKRGSERLDELVRVPFRTFSRRKLRPGPRPRVPFRQQSARHLLKDSWDYKCISWAHH